MTYFKLLSLQNFAVTSGPNMKTPLDLRYDGPYPSVPRGSPHMQSMQIRSSDTFTGGAPSARSSSTAFLYEALCNSNCRSHAAISSKVKVTVFAGMASLGSWDMPGTKMR